MGLRSALLAVLVMFAVLPVAAAARTGAYSATRPLDDRTRALALSLRGPAEQLTNERYSVWRPVSYRSQVVAGTNYLFVRETGAALRRHLGRSLPLSFHLFLSLSDALSFAAGGCRRPQGRGESLCAAPLHQAAHPCGVRHAARPRTLTRGLVNSRDTHIQHATLDHTFKQDETREQQPSPSLQPSAPAPIPPPPGPRPPPARPPR